MLHTTIAAYNNPDYAKVAANFYLGARENGQVKLGTETRIHVPDPATWAKFGRYWRLIKPGSGLIRMMWLKPIKRRAERS